jgi:hypothetical protein
VSHDTAVAFYIVVLWGAALGILIPRSSRHIVCRRSKQLAALTFVCLVVETFRYGY